MKPQSIMVTLSTVLMLTLTGCSAARLPRAPLRLRHPLRHRQKTRVPRVVKTVLRERLFASPPMRPQ